MVDWQRFCIRVENICFGSSGVVAFKLNFRFTFETWYYQACEICQKLPIIYIKIVKCVVYSNEKICYNSDIKFNFLNSSVSDHAVIGKR